jgi:predicted Rossmann fold nucleotide-binding protein DprA/Smf involved in DNA uptake
MTEKEVTKIKTKNMTIAETQKQNSLLKFIVENSETFDIYKKASDIYPKLLNPTNNKPVILMILGGLLIIAVLLFSLPSGIGLVTKYIFAS